MLTATKEITAQDWRAISATQNETIGATAVTSDNRTFRYGLAGAADLAIGKIAQMPAVVANHQNITVAGNAGDTVISVTLGATAATLNQYSQGYLGIFGGTGAGQTLLINGNPAIALSTAGTVSLVEPLTTTLAATPKANLLLNPYSGAIISATTTIDYIVGVPGITITAAYYGWFQTKGVASVLTNGTPAAGAGVIASATTAGAVDVEGAAAVTQRLGVVYASAGTSTKYSSVYLNIG